MLQDIKESEALIVQKFEAAISGTGLDISRDSLQELKRLAHEAEVSGNVLDKLLVKEESLVRIIKDQEMRLRDICHILQEQLLAQMSDKDQECL